MPNSKARDLASLLSGSGTGTIAPALVSDQDNASTGHFDVPAGTTAQRPSSPNTGMVRYNTTLGNLEQYTADGWQSIAPPPVVSSISPTTYDGSSGSSFTISGQNFDNNVTVKFITSGGNETAAATVTRNSSSSLTVTTAQTYSVADEPLDVKVTNGTGLSSVLEGAIDAGGLPTFTTASGLIVTVNDRYDAYNPVAIIVATDPDGGAVSYAVKSGSSLPAGMTLNTSNGQISGDPTDVSADTTTNFTIVATDVGSNTTERSFSIKVNRTDDGTSSTRAFENPNGAIGYASSGTATLYTTIYGTQSPFQTTVSFADAANPKYRTTRTASQLGSPTYGSGAYSNVGGETTLIDGSGNGCSEGTTSAYNWYGAVTACMKRGARLCTREEIQAGASAGSGCSHDSRAIWTSTKNASGQYYIQEGATPSNNQYRSPTDMSGLGFVGLGQVGIRCCSSTSNSDWFA